MVICVLLHTNCTYSLYKLTTRLSVCKSLQGICCIQSQPHKNIMPHHYSRYTIQLGHSDWNKMICTLIHSSWTCTRQVRPPYHQKEWLTAVDTCLCYMRKAGNDTKPTSLEEAVIGAYRHVACVNACIITRSSVMRGFRWTANDWVIAVHEWSPSIPRLHTCVQDSLQLLLAEWLYRVSVCHLYPPRALKCSGKELTNLLTER